MWMKLLFIWLFTVNERAISLGFVFATKMTEKEPEDGESVRKKTRTSKKQSKDEVCKRNQMKCNFSTFSTLYAECIIGQAYHRTKLHQSHFMDMCVHIFICYVTYANLANTNFEIEI